ncbi:hypothetical protein ZIOFF_042813 [Zingiber officinale]|uniref:glutaredoxin-dependent peroxiredoxin n=1 Tax=Zingiber officinale TaxID=94328 RepID=A0A8J5FY18_ZINOF|nr:hypothetical protein ZIOFF_042813 [Zingiber officinale]
MHTRRSSLFPRLFASSASTLVVATTISVGDNLPDANLSYFGSDGELQTVTISDLTKGKKAIFFVVPGPLRLLNDAFVMHAWKKDLNIKDEVLLLSDGNREFTLALGVELDLSDKPMGLGLRSRRYALLVEDGVVKVLNLEDGGLASFVEYIPNARVSLLKYIHRQHNISFDVSVNNHLGVMKSNVLKWLSKIDDRFRDMLKEWAKAQDINDPKSRSLSSYAFCLLVIFHFQDGVTSLGVLLRMCVPQYTEFSDIRTSGSDYSISTYEGRQKRHRFCRSLPLIIEDPFERMENATRTVHWVELPKISNAFQNEHNKLSSGSVLSNHDSLLSFD